MTELLGGLLRFALRGLLLLAGVVFLLSAVVAGLLLALPWLLRRAWARLTGQPVPVSGLDPVAFFRQQQARSQAWRGEAERPPGRPVQDVEDAVIKTAADRPQPPNRA